MKYTLGRKIALLISLPLIWTLLLPPVTYSNTHLRQPATASQDGSRKELAQELTSLGVDSRRKIAQRSFTVAEFASGVLPLKEMLEEDLLISDLTSTTVAVLDLAGLRGGGKERKREADTVSKLVFQRIFEERGAVGFINVSEGLGRDYEEVGPAGAFGALEVVNPIGEGEIVHVIVDVLENTNAAAANNQGIGTASQGAISMIAVGEGVKRLGNSPDIYADTVITKVPKGKKPLFTGENALDPETPVAQLEGVLQRIADANGIRINDIELMLMERGRETERLTEWERLAATYEGFTIVQITDGTAAHAIEAIVGRKNVPERKHKVVWTIGGAPEGFFALAGSGIFKEEGAVMGMRLYSKEVNHSPAGKDTAVDLAWRYHFNDEEKEEIHQARPAEAEAIIQGKKLFTQGDVQGDVLLSVSFLTDNPTLGEAGVERLPGGARRVKTLLARSGLEAPYLWFETRDVDQALIPGLVFEEMLTKEIPEFSLSLSPALLQSTQKGTIVVYEEALNNLTIARQIELLAEKLKKADSKIGFSLVSTSGKTEHEIVEGIREDSQGTIDLRGAFQTALVQGRADFDVLDPQAVSDALEEQDLPLLELIAPREVVHKYQSAGIKLYAWLVSGNPKENESGIANGAQALWEMVELFGLSQVEKETLLRTGGQKFTVVIQQVGQEVEDFDRFYRENRGV